MKRPNIENIKVEYINGVAEISSVVKQYSRLQDNYIDYLEKNNQQFKEALFEVAKWEEQATEYERTKISFSEAIKCVVNRIFEKYNRK